MISTSHSSTACLIAYFKVSKWGMIESRSRVNIYLRNESVGTGVLCSDLCYVQLCIGCQVQKDSSNMCPMATLVKDMLMVTSFGNLTGEVFLGSNTLPSL